MIKSRLNSSFSP